MAISISYQMDRLSKPSNASDGISMEGAQQMLMFVMFITFAIAAGIVNIWLARLKPTVESRVADLLIVVAVDTLLLIGYKIWVGDDLFGICLIIKYLFFCCIDFDKTLRRGI
jgi:hypothetical protein